MTNEEINKIIAEFRGWVEYHPTPESISKGYPSYSYWIPPRDSKQSFENWGKLEMDYPPDYCNNLNAMAEAKNLLTGDKRREFIDYLYEIVKQDKNINAGPYSVMIEAFYATAKQQAIAFVKTIGKWKK
jgi:hypothetical protein